MSAFPLDSRFGLARGFDVYDDRFVGRSGAARVPGAGARGAGDRGARPAMARGGRRAPWFCWVHLYEPHCPYAPPEPFAARFRERAVPRRGGRHRRGAAPLARAAARRGPTAGRTLVVLTADHGESLGEHGEATHGIFAYEATLRVPLVLYQPRLFRPRTVSAPPATWTCCPPSSTRSRCRCPPGSPAAASSGRGRAAGDRGRDVLRGALRPAQPRLGAALRRHPRRRRSTSSCRSPSSTTSRAIRARRRTSPRRVRSRSRPLRAALAPFRAADAGARRAPRERGDAREAAQPRLPRRGRRGREAALHGGGRPQAPDRRSTPRCRTSCALFTSGDVAGARAVPGRSWAAGRACRWRTSTSASSSATTATSRRRRGAAQALALNPQDTVVATLLAARPHPGGPRGRGGWRCSSRRPRAAEPDLDVLTTRALAAAPARPRRGRARGARPRARARPLERASADGARHRAAHGGRAREARAAFEQALVRTRRAAHAESALGDHGGRRTAARTRRASASRARAPPIPRESGQAAGAGVAARQRAAAWARRAATSSSSRSRRPPRSSNASSQQVRARWLGPSRHAPAADRIDRMIRAALLPAGRRLLCLAAAPLTAAATTPSPADARRAAAAAAEASLEAGELQIAESHYRAALVEGFLVLGSLDAADGRLDEARDAFQARARVHGRRAARRAAPGDGAAELGEAKEAVTLLTQPRDANAARHAGRAGCWRRRWSLAGRPERGGAGAGGGARRLAPDDLELALHAGRGLPAREEARRRPTRCSRELATRAADPADPRADRPRPTATSASTSGRAGSCAPRSRSTRARAARTTTSAWSAVLEEAVPGSTRRSREFRAELKLAPADPAHEPRARAWRS